MGHRKPAVGEDNPCCIEREGNPCEMSTAGRARLPVVAQPPQTLGAGLANLGPVGCQGSSYIGQFGKSAAQERLNWVETSHRVFVVEEPNSDLRG